MGAAPWREPTASHRVDGRGLALHVVEWRPPRAVAADAATVVLHHGFLDHARSWDAVASLLAERRRVLALDARGHGASGRVGAGGYYYFHDYVADLSDVLDALVPAPAPVALVGHSMGGMVVSLYAGTFPARPAAIVSIEGAGPPAASFDDAPERMREWITAVRRVRATSPRAMPSVAAAAARLTTFHPRLEPAMASHLARHGTEPAPGGGVTWRHDPLHRTPLPIPFYLEQARAFWRRITAPALLVHGERTSFVWDPAERREPLADARRVEIPDAGHMIHQEAPAALAEVLADFLDEVDAARAQASG